MRHYLECGVAIAHVSATDSCVDDAQLICTHDVTHLLPVNLSLAYLEVTAVCVVAGNSCPDGHLTGLSVSKFELAKRMHASHPHLSALETMCHLFT